MNIETTFSCGDTGWVCRDGSPLQLTVGKVAVEIVDSPGRPGGSQFSNFAPQSSYAEKYMCVETGIGSGSVYTLGEHIFTTEGECLTANEKRIAEYAAEKLAQAQRQREQLLSRESSLLTQLAEIEALKANAA